MDSVSELVCRSCPKDYPFPVRYIATPKRITGEAVSDWPVCEGHSEFAMVAGWFPLLTVDEYRASLASPPLVDEG